MHQKYVMRKKTFSSTTYLQWQRECVRDKEEEEDIDHMKY